MDLHLLRLPLPLRLDHLNAYLIAGPTGHALVDTGMATPDGREALATALADHGLEPAQLQELFITHYHGDHFGLAAWLQSLGVRVLMSRVDSELLQHWFAHPSYDAEAVALYRKHGVPAVTLGRAAHALSRMRAISPRFAPERTVEDGEEIPLAGELFQVWLTPGHTPGHACLYHRESQVLLLGDHVLPHITPNISREPVPRSVEGRSALDDPLTAYRRSLRALRQRDISLAWPAHGEAMGGSDLQRRIDEILRHHEEREESLLALMGEETRSGFDLCQDLFNLSTLDGWETWMALGETLAHLIALQTAGRVLCDEEHETTRWRRASPSGVRPDRPASH